MFVNRIYRSGEFKLQIKEVWKLSLPAILTQIVTIVMQYIDSAMVGSMGAKASASIGLVASTTWLFGGIVHATATGFSVQVAHCVGAKDTEGTKNVVRHGIVTALIISGILCLAGVLLSGKLPVILGGEAEIQNDASNYFFVYSLMIPFFQLNTLCSKFLQCSGDMVTPSILNASMCVLDVILNAIFIPNYGVLGAAMGTAFAFVIISLIMFSRCVFVNEYLKLTKAMKGRFQRSILKKAFKIGAPIAVEELAMNSAMVAATMIIAPLGPVAIAANSFAVTAESLCYMPGYGIGSAATTLVGRNIGAGEEKLAKRYGNICIGMGGIMMGITGVIMAVICPLIFMFLTPDPAVRELATNVLRIELLAEPLFGISIVASGALHGTGDTLVPSILNLGSIWGVRIVLAIFLVGPFGLYGMWIAMASELCIRGLLMLFRQKTTKYYSKRKEA